MSSANGARAGADHPSLTAQELADRLGLDFASGPNSEQTGSASIQSAATLSAARQDQLSFLANIHYRDQLTATNAGAVILSEDMLKACPTAAIISKNPYASWARALELLHPAPAIQPGIAPSASIDPTAEIDPTACIEALCHIGAGARIGAGVRVGAGSIVERNASVDEHCRLTGKVYLGEGVRLGRRVIVHPGVVIGADGFGLAMDDGQWRKIAQLGSVKIGDDCEIGANTTIDRGALEDTVLGRDVRLDNQVQVAHNVIIEDHTAIAGCVGIAGSTRIGRYCMIAGASGIGGHLSICDHVVITAMSTVLDSIDEPGTYGSGIPARTMRNWQRTLVRLTQLDRWMRSSKTIKNR